MDRTTRNHGPILGGALALAFLFSTAHAQASDAPNQAEANPPTSSQVSGGTSSQQPEPPPSLDGRSQQGDESATSRLSRLELAEQAAAERAKTASTVSAEEAGFGISSPDQKFRVRIHGQLQIDGRSFFGDGSLQNSDTFLIRRARPTIEVTLLGLADALITPDFAGGTLQLFDAYIDLHPRRWLRLRAGKFKPPVGLERLQSDNNMVFTERALDQDLSAQRDVGIQLWGDVAAGILRYEAAILNGVPDSTLNDVDSDYAKSIAGRIFVQPFAPQSLRWLGRLGVGLAVETGNEQGSAAIANGAVTGTWLGALKSVGQNTIFSYVSSTTSTNQTVIALHRHTRINPQLYYYYGPVGLEAEYLRERQGVDKGGADTTLTNSAGHATVGYVLGGDRTYEGPRVRNPLNLETGSLGALEIGARYNWLTIYPGAFPTLADPTKSIAKAKGMGLVLSWYLSQSLRLAASYDQTWFTEGTKNGSATADRPTEKVFIGRFQVGY